MKINPILLVDFYKVHHQRMYPDNMIKLYSNWTPRSSRIASIQEVVVFGVQHFVKEYLIKMFNEDFFNQKKEEIYNVYTKCALLDRGYIKSTVKFLDQFYSTINDKKSIARDFGYPCDESGTGNVVIKGLKE